MTKKNLLEYIARKLRALHLSKTMVSSLFDSKSELSSLRQELSTSGFLDQLDKKLQKFHDLEGKTQRGNEYALGTMDVEEAELLYAITRKVTPKNIVETGVCNGYSSAVILYALERNGFGELHSIDFPEIAGETYAEGTFWEGKGGAVVPPQLTSGWIIPDELRNHWHLHLGKSQDLLPGLLAEIGTIDIFIHDSEHSYECMMFEYQTAYPALKNRGLLISDDISWNASFYDFCKTQKIKPGYVAGNMGLAIKP